MSIWKALFGKPEPRKSKTYADWHQPAAPRQSENCDENDVDGMGYYITRDVGNAKQFEIDPDQDSYNTDFSWTMHRFYDKIETLKQQRRSFFVCLRFYGHDEGAQTHYHICESREQMESICPSYDDCIDQRIPHEFILNVVDGEQVYAPPEWWQDYEKEFEEKEMKRQWQEKGSSQYRL